MVETAENVWSDSCVCAMTDKDLRGSAGGSGGSVSAKMKAEDAPKE